SLFAMRFSPDGRRLAIALSNENDPAATSYVVKWDFPGGRLAGPVSSLPSVTNGGLGNAADGRRSVGVGGGGGVVDSGGRRLKTYEVGPEHSAAVSPDGRTVLLGHDDGSVTFVD